MDRSARGDAINNHSQIDTLTISQQDDTRQSFLTTNGVTRPIFGPNGTPGVIGIPDDHGQALGYYISDGQMVITVWSHGTMRPLSLPPDVTGIAAVNDFGQRLGDYRPTDALGQDAALLRNGHVENLGSLGAGTPASDELQIFDGGQLNDRDQIAALIQQVYLDNPSLDTERSSFWSNGHVTDLGSLGGADTYETALNNDGVVVGASDLSGTVEHGFIWQNGKMKDIGTLPGDSWSGLTGINDLGVAIGDSGSGSIGDVVDHPVIWSDGRLTPIASLIPADSGWDVQSLDDINDRDQIVGLGLFDGQERAFLLTPATAQFIPEPSAMGLACGALVLLRRARRR